MKILAITQARIGSTRLPEKILKTVNDESLLEIHLKRILKSERITKLKVATTTEPDSEKIVKIAKKVGVEIYKGSVDNVLDRFYQTALPEDPDWIVRLTSDCPLIDPVIIDHVIDLAISKNLDYASNTLDPTFPDGMDTEIFKFSALKKAIREAKLPSEFEHVTPYIWKNSTYKGGKLFKSDCYKNSIDFSSFRLTVDTIEDFKVIEKIINLIGTDKSWYEYVKILQKYPNIKEINKQFIRNEGYIKSLKQEKMKNDSKSRSGQNLYKKAKQLIPGGTMLLSKRPEMFLPENWPSYYSRAKGSKVWDLDGNEYIDMCIMGIGTNTLGYGNDEVDNAVRETISKGNMSTLNCPEEVWLAEKLIELNPWADMVRYTRTGGEGNAVAIRIARAASGKDNVAICGYHGWHDWYLASNLGGDDILSEHLLSGLDTAGVPKSLKNTVFPFHYNNYEELENIVLKHNIGVIKMEVIRNFEPQNNFLQNVRELATKNNIVLIFDECTSGFRETYGGIFNKYGVLPDIAIFSKTMGNGYAITAVVGKRSVMEAAQKTFISSTFWTERIGPTAALKTLEVMKKTESWKVITEKGKKMQTGWQKIAKENNLEISLSGIPALSSYSFKSDKALEYKTFITQEMLKKGFLASTIFYAAITHEDKFFDPYFNALNDIYKIIAECEKGNENIYNLLEGPVCHTGFQRLN